NYTILPGANLPAGQFTFGVPPGATNGPIGTGVNTQGLTIVGTVVENLSPIGPIPSLNPTFQWQFDVPDSDVRGDELFVSVYHQVQGLLPEDQFVTLPEPDGDPTLASANLSRDQQVALLSTKFMYPDGTSVDDYNPHRILTKQLEPGTTSYTLPAERML